MRAAVAILLAASALAQTPPSASELIAGVAERYRAPKSFLLTGTTSATTGDKPAGQPLGFTVAVEFPAKVRVEGALAAFGGAMSLYVSDGGRPWLHDPITKTYYQFPPFSEAEIAARHARGDPDPSRPDEFARAMERAMFVRYRAGLPPTATATNIASDTITRQDGTAVSCHVVRIDTPGFDAKTPGARRLTWWIDAQRSDIWREDQATWMSNGALRTTSAVFDQVLIDEPLPAGLFQFVPPPGSKKGKPPKSR